MFFFGRTHRSAKVKRSCHSGQWPVTTDGSDWGTLYAVFSEGNAQSAARPVLASVAAATSRTEIWKKHGK